MSILFNNFYDIFCKVYELELHKKRIRRKLKSNLNTSKMAETNRQLNMTCMSNMDYSHLVSPSGIGTTFGFESARSTMGGGNNSSAEMLLPGEKQQPNIAILNTQHLETNYLATELDRDGDASLLSSAEVSPREHTDRRLNTSDVFSVAPDINNATSSRMTKARYIRHKKTRELERKYRKATGDTKTDFVDYLEFLVQFFKITERLDAAGCTLQKVFGLVSEDGDDVDSTGEEGSSD